MDSDPPFHKAYETFCYTGTTNNNNNRDQEATKVIVDERELRLIDLQRLEIGDFEGEECKTDIARASQEWGFFQVVNHGISIEVLQKMKNEQEKVFKESFVKKSQEHKYLNFSAGTYRWRSPTATSLRQLSWSEAFHIPLNKVPASSAAGLDDLSSTMEQFVTTVSPLALKLVEVLAEKLGHGRRSSTKTVCQILAIFG